MWLCGVVGGCGVGWKVRGVVPGCGIVVMEYGPDWLRHGARHVWRLLGFLIALPTLNLNFQIQSPIFCL